MSETWKRIQELVARSEVRISEHGYDEIAEDDIRVRDVLAGISAGVVVEDYPEYPKGPCVLVLEHDRESRPIHAVWGIPRGSEAPAVVVTAYRPDPERWTEDYMRRRP